MYAVSNKPPLLVKLRLYTLSWKVKFISATNPPLSPQLKGP